jgi:hypothetical protein
MKNVNQRRKLLNYTITFRDLNKWNKQMDKIIKIVGTLKKEIKVLENIRIDFDVGDPNATK